MGHIFVLGGLRSYTSIRNSAHRHIPTECLGAAVLKGLIRQCGCDDYAPGAVDPGAVSPGTISPKDIDMIIYDNSADNDGDITRLMALETGPDQSIPTFTMNQQYISSLEAITTAAAIIESGLCHLIVAGELGNTSTQPLRSCHPNHPDYKDITSYTTVKFILGPCKKDVMLQDAKQTVVYYHMDKQDLDRWILENHRRALMARQSRIPSDIILPVLGLERDEDTCPRINQELLDRPLPVLQDGRSLSAANACTTNDGVASTVLRSDQYLVRHGLAVRCRTLDACGIGTNPPMSPVSAVSSIENLLRRTSVFMDEVGCIECNEASAVIDVLFERAYPGTFSCYNQFGGTLAYGRPYGASEAIILLRLVKTMEHIDSQKGICSMTAAGGIGTALILEWQGPYRSNREQSLRQRKIIKPKEDIMGYFEMIRAVPAHRTILTEDSNCYTYGGIVRDADEIGHQSDLLNPGLEWIDETSVYGQLIRFLAYNGIDKIPVIISRKTTRRPILGSPVLSIACVGVLTPNTMGVPKIWFRTFESWHSFFPIQSHIFGINSSSRMLVRGNLAFIGNLNMYLPLMSEGASATTYLPAYPSAWSQTMVGYQANGIYLIPSKLRPLARTASGYNSYIKTVVSGSQSLGLGDIHLLRTVHPNNQCTLYYGANELSFVSFIRDFQMNSDPAHVGLPFSGINTTIKNNEISVDTPYRVLGLPTPCSIGDMGYTGTDGYLYLLGHKNNVYNIHGRKIPASLIEHALMALDEVDEVAVTLEHDTLIAYVVLNPQSEGTSTYCLLMEQLKRHLSPHELPCKIIYTEELLKSSSGKPAPSLLSAADPH